MVENKVKHTIIYAASECNIEWVMKQILWHDVIAFETQNVGNLPEKLTKYLQSLTTKDTNPKHIIECYGGTPEFQRMPKSIHKMWSLMSLFEDVNDWKISDITNNSYWERIKLNQQ